MTIARLCVLTLAFGLFSNAQIAEAQFELTPPLTATSHAFSLTNALRLQLPTLLVEGPAAEVQTDVAYVATQRDAPSRRYHLWSILWGGGVVVTGVGGLVWLVDQFNGTFFGAAMFGVGGLMMVGGMIGHIIGGIRYRRRVREYEQGAVYLEGTTLHW